MIDRHSLAPLRHRQFRYFLGARFAALFGNAIAPIALAFAVLDLEHSPTALGLVLAARTVPMVGLMLVGGVVADRLPRQYVMVVSYATCFGTQGLAAGLLLTGRAEIWQLAVIEAINGAAVAFWHPATIGIVPALVDQRELQQANALSGMARSITVIGGASMGGVIVGFLGPGWGMAVDALTFGVATLLLSRLRLPPIERATSRPLRELREGWQEFVARRWLWLIVGAFTVLMAAESCAWTTLGPVVADETFGRTAWGVIASVQSVGTVIGTVLLLRFRPRWPMRLGMLGMIAGAPSMLLLGLYPEVPALLVVAVIDGVGAAFFGVAWETALQQHVPEAALSRVSAYDAFGSIAAVPIGQLVAGPLAAAFGVSAVVVGGGLIFATVAAGTLLDRSVRNLPREAPSPANAPAESAHV